MPGNPAPRSLPPRIDFDTLVAAVTVSAAHGASRREACKKILGQTYRVVAAVLGPTANDVADVTQEAFMRVYDGISSFDPSRSGGPTAWVNTIALRTALDYRRSKFAREERALDESPPDDGPPLEEALSEDLEEVLDRSNLAAVLLEQLDERHRGVLVLRYWSGQTDEEIAKTLETPLGTVKSWAAAAKRKLEDYVRTSVRSDGASAEERPVKVGA